MSEPVRQSISGDLNQQTVIQIKQLLLTHASELFDAVMEACGSLDGRVMQAFPQGICPAGNPSSPTRFDSSRICTSLLRIGVPLRAALLVVIRTVEDVLVLEQDALSTTDVKKLIIGHLYNLDPAYCNIDDRQEWGDAYVRRYGRESPVIVLYEGCGTEAHLTYSLLETEVLPEVVEDVTSRSFARYMLGSKDLARMSATLMEHVLSLNVYRIHYGTLKAMARDISLQPPHPWLVRSPYNNHTIAYDLRQVMRHRQKVRRDLAVDRHHSLVSSIRECVRHACSCILAYYGHPMGCGHMAPLYNLSEAVRGLVQDKDSSEVAQLCELPICAFPHDLAIMDRSIHELAHLLSRLKRGLHALGSHDRDVVTEYIGHVDELYRYMRAVTMKSRVCEHFLKSEILAEKPEALLRPARFLFQGILGGSSDRHEEGVAGFWVSRRKSIAPIEEMKRLVWISLGSWVTPVRNCEQELDVIERKGPLSNSCIIIHQDPVSPSQTDMWRDATRSWLRGDKLLLPIPISTLSAIGTSGNSLREFQQYCSSWLIQ